METGLSFLPLLSDFPHYLVVAGPCSAETEEQVLQTARALQEKQVHLFRAGIWKPRTRPNSFEGVGKNGLPWLQRVQSETGLKVTIEVANAQHVEAALEHGMDVLWIGARTTANPFSVQEIADALRGVDIPVMVKNPVNPDLKLWIGAIERLYDAGIRRMVAIHRGFSFYGESTYRNVPRWQIPIDLMHQVPGLPIICDCSHICGRRDILAETAQKALDLNFNGLMLEVHPDPDQAWSDPKQQVTPTAFSEILDQLVFRKSTTDDYRFLKKLEHMRQLIDEIDEEVLRLLGERMRLAEDIGDSKRRSNISILQPDRWSEILERGILRGRIAGLSEEFTAAILRSIHQESINHQSKVMQGKATAATVERGK